MDIYDQLSDVRQRVVRKEADIESINERLDGMEEPSTDDVHRAETKLRHERDRLIELKCKQVILECEILRERKNG
jgi:hypothetical protein